MLISAWFCLHNVVRQGAGVQQVRTAWCRAQGAGDLSTGSYPNTDTQLLTASPPRRQAPARSPGPANFFPSSYRKLLHNTSLHLQSLQHTTQKIFRADADACLLLYARNINIKVSDNFFHFAYRPPLHSVIAIALSLPPTTTMASSSNTKGE